MHHTDHRNGIAVNVETLECDIPADEWARLQDALNGIAEAAKDIAASLDLKVIQHPQNAFHAEAALRLPDQSLFTGDWDPYLDTAVHRCLRKLRHRIDAYKSHPQPKSAEVAHRVERMNDAIVAPQDPDEGPVAGAARAGDYGKFRNLLADYEDWLSDRVGRWVQRYPEIDARIGDDLLLGDIVEEVYLKAMQRYEERTATQSLGDWLNSLIDSSLREMVSHPIEERENIGMARTMRESSR